MAKTLENSKNDIEKNLKYLGLMLGKVPEFLNNDKTEFKISKTSMQHKIKEYRHIPIDKIKILLSPTNRQDDLQEKYQNARFLSDYLKHKNTEESKILYTKFLSMVKNMDISEIEKIEKEQEKLKNKMTFNIKYENSYLWQVYYSKINDVYFMIVPTKEDNIATLFYILKKQIEKSKDTIFIPIENAEYSNKYLKKRQLEDISEYLWLFTKNYPSMYEVYDNDDELKIVITGQTNIYQNIKSKYKIELKSKEEAIKFLKHIKILYIIGTEASKYFEFKTKIGKKGELLFCLDNKLILYKTIPKMINKEYSIGSKKIKDANKEITKNRKKLQELQKDLSTLEYEYLEKEKQISTYLECKKTFFGKVKYYFKYSGKKTKKINNENVIENIDENIDNDYENNIDETKVYSKFSNYSSLNQVLKNSKKLNDKKYSENINDSFDETKKLNKTVDELIEKYKEYEDIEKTLKELVMDINAIKLKSKNTKKKIENAALFIEQIDKHKRSIFEFWKYSNKDEVAALSEGEIEEVQTIKPILKSFNYEDDFEKFGITMDNIQKNNLNKSELDYVFLTTTNILEILNRIKSNQISPKILEANLKILKKELALINDTNFDNLEIDKIGVKTKGDVVNSKINDKKHRESKKDKFDILNLSEDTSRLEYKRILEKSLHYIKKAMKKITISEEITAFKISNDKYIPKKIIEKNEYQYENNDQKDILDSNNIDYKEFKNYMLFNCNVTEELQNFQEKENNKEEQTMNLYKINLRRGTNLISFTNSVYYNNKNKTLPIGQNLSNEVLIDLSNMELELVAEEKFRILEENQEDEFLMPKIKEIEVFEYNIVVNKRIEALI